MLVADLCRIYNGLFAIGLVATFFPKKLASTQDVTKKAVLAQIDYVGGILSTIGITLLYVR